MTATLFIVSAPSGAGKTSLLRELVPADPRLSLSVSHTTRAARPGEVDGEHYHFVSLERFRELQDAGAFIESAQVFDNFYGTSEQAIRDQLSAGQDVIVEIDWQGARQVRQRIPEAVSLFILPPSRQALHDRLGNRGQDSEQIIARRMRDAQSEMSHYDEYDYLIFNDDFDTALAELRAIFTAQRLRLAVQRERHAGQIAELLGG